MHQLTHKSAQDALEWMKSLEGRLENQVLFRGQRRVWPTIKPSITRVDEKTRRNLWTIVRWFCAHGAVHLTGYRIDEEHDRLSILQHYLGFSPVIDLTGTPEIALYFALKNANVGDECVVYSVDQNKACVSSVVLSDHLFLALPIQSGGDQHRWLCQDGYSVGPQRWRDLNVVQHFDMLKLPGVSSMRFQKKRNDGALVEELGDLESTLDDPLAYMVYGNVKGFARALDVLTPEIQKILETSAMIDPDDELTLEIDQLIEKATKMDVQKSTLDELHYLKKSLQQGTWDTSFYAGLCYIRKKLSCCNKQN